MKVFLLMLVTISCSPALPEKKYDYLIEVFSTTYICEEQFHNSLSDCVRFSDGHKIDKIYNASNFTKIEE